MPFFVAFETFSHLFLFLLPTFLGYMPILVAVEALQLSIFEIVIAFSNIHRLSLPSIYCFWSCFKVLSSFCRFVSLSNQDNRHILLLECLWCHNRWIFQYHFDNILSYIFFSKKIACSLSISVFIANVSNLIIKSTVFFFPYLKDSILHSAYTAFILSLNVVLISLINSSQS